MEPDKGGMVMSESKNRSAILWVLGASFVTLACVGFVSWLKDKQKDEALAQSRSDTCFNAVKKTSRYPSKAVFLDSPSLLATGMSGRVEFMNGFGAMIPHRYECEFYSGSSTALKGSPVVTEGG